MNPGESRRADPSAIKMVFGEVLDAKRRGRDDDAESLLTESPPEVRDAVRLLLKAHDRASGVLLDEPDTAQADPAPNNPLTATPTPAVSGYEIGQELGRGGFGIVYHARQRVPIDRKVAIKVLRRDLESDEAIRRFRGESTLLARMSHESIARVFDAGLTDQGQPFVAMELIDGPPLLDACSTLGLDTKARVRLMARICDAVQHAHQRAVIHRDLKPANILVEHNGDEICPRVIDFGIAKLLDSEHGDQRTMADVRLGTPRYMSPEQRLGGEITDTRVDVYALGSILCEMLAGDVPTASAESGRTRSPQSPSGSRISKPSTIAGGHTDRSLTSPRALRGDLDRIVLKACAQDPDLRYASAQAMADDLRRYLDGMPVVASPPGLIYLSRKFMRRHRASVSLAGMLGVALLFTLAIAILKWNEATQQRDQARASSARAVFIGEFLLEMLVLTADSNARGTPPAVTDGTMQRIADRAAAGLDEDPESMLAMLQGIGRLQAQSGQAEAGTETLRRALAFAIGRYGIPSPEVVSLRVRLHDLLWGHGLEGWKQQIELADAEAAQLFEAGDPRRMRVLQRSDGTPENLQRIIDHYQRSQDADPADHYQALFSLTMLHRFGPTPEKQLDTARLLCDVAISYYPPDHTAVIDSLALYGEVMSTFAPSTQAEEMLLDAYERATRVLGLDHFTTESIRRALARLYGMLDRPEEGIPFALADIESVTNEFGPDSIQYANALYELGRLYTKAGQYAPARDALSQSLTLRQGQWSEGHRQITTTQVYLARVHAALGNHDQAETLASLALEHLNEPRDASTIAAAMRIRIGICEREGNQERAEELRAEAVAILNSLGIDDQSIQSLLTKL